MNYYEDYSSNYAGMSSDKICEKHIHRKSKIFKENVMYFELVSTKFKTK